LSESVQMYLVTIARLRQGDQPVPLSLLAEALAVSPVSVNEMCRKLQDQGLLIYTPYKGVVLTNKGETRACYILRRHRLWEVFLFDKLGIAFDQAHDIACQLEHATPNELADQLDLYLNYPPVNPLGEPIPRCDVQPPAAPTVALAALPPGRRGCVTRCDLEDEPRTFLTDQGVRPGAWLKVVAAGKNAVLIQVRGEHLSLTRALAEGIQVQVASPVGDAAGGIDQESPDGSRETVAGSVKLEESMNRGGGETAGKPVPLNSLKEGQRAIVVRMDAKGPVRRRMMDMGLLPGSEVVVRRKAPLGDPIEFTVKGYSLSLRRSEAGQIQVEPLG